MAVAGAGAHGGVAFAAVREALVDEGKADEFLLIDALDDGGVDGR